MMSPEQPISEPCGLTLARLARLSDEEVMAHIQAGHDDALAVLFDRYHRLVVSVAFKILRDLGEAEDVTQVVFLEVYKASAQFDPTRGTTKVWLMQYAYHRSMNRRVYLKRRKFYDQDEGATADSGFAENARPVSGGGLFVLQELRSLVREGLESLNKIQRQTIHLAYFEGLSLKEISERTGDSIGNVRHHYYRGLGQLRVFVSKGNRNGNGKKSSEVVRRGTIDVEA
jgi:RNA polymerase sigma-70 factor (ECF subfamily)